MSGMSDKPTSLFSRRFASALGGYMRENRIRQSVLAERLDKSAGFVSEHISGKRPCDTDMLDAVAELAGISSRALYDEVGRRMANAESPAAREDDVEAVAERIAAAARANVQPEIEELNGLTEGHGQTGA